MDEDHKLDHLKDGFTRFVADNVDHNTDTLDGKGTFHEISIIACSILNKVIPKKKISIIACSILNKVTPEKKRSEHKQISNRSNQE